MALYNFKERFVPFIQDGSKQQTIREIRKYPQKVGGYMHLYCGLRLIKPALKIIASPICTDVKTIFIFGNKRVFLVDAIMTKPEALKFLRVLTKGKKLPPNTKLLTKSEKDRLAFHDGFRANGLETKGCFNLMFQFFGGKLPFIGHINYWN